MSEILLINPPVHDFTAYDLWLKPLGLLDSAARPSPEHLAVDVAGHPEKPGPKSPAFGIERTEALEGAPPNLLYEVRCVRLARQDPLDADSRPRLERRRNALVEAHESLF